MRNNMKNTHVNLNTSFTPPFNASLAIQVSIDGLAYTMVPAMINCVGINQVFRRPNLGTNTASTMGAHNNFKEKGHETNANMFCCVKLTLFADRTNDTAAVNPMGIPCKVYNNNNNATLP